jgi:aminoglycoside phosphotransferase (APT) family kinase protein
MLSERQVVDRLIELRLVSPATIVAGDLAVHDASRRNRNFKVVSDGAPSFLVKQGFGAEGRATLTNEAAVYRVLASGGPDLVRHVPQFHGWDPDHAMLVLELVESAHSLTEHQARGRFSQQVARSVGRALGALHAIPVEPNDPTGLYPTAPFALSVHRPEVSWLRDISEANIELIKLLQGAPGLPELLDELRASWQPHSIVHNDYKSENCMVVRGRGGRGTGIRLVDWESAGVGDPGWDAGSVFGDYLASWLASIPITGQDPPERFPELARFPLERMRPALRAFWEAYVGAAGLTPMEGDQRLVQAARFSATRLLQTAFEQTQAGSRLTGTTMCLLQVAVNILRRPHEAAVRLLGIPLTGAVAA